MRKLKLLFAALALLVGGAGSASAQSWTDVTSTYITNADLKNISVDADTDSEYWPVYTAGRTGNKHHPKNWYLHTNGTTNHNGGGDNYECWAANLGVKRWTLFQDITLPAGAYRLTGQYSTNENRGIIKTVAITPHHTYFSTGITSSNWGSWGSEAVEFKIYEETKVRVGMISTNFAQNHGFTLETTGAKQLLADEIAAAPAALSTEKAAAQGVYDNGGLDDAAYRSAAKTLHDAIISYNLENSTTSSPVDVTDKIANPSFESVGETNPLTGESGNCFGWTVPSVTDGGAKSATGNSYLITDDSEDGFYLANFWNSGATTFYVKQALSSLPAGQYKLTATYASDADNTASLYMGSTINKTTITATEKGHFVSGSVTYNVTSTGDVEIGMESTSWMKADGFKLSYLGPNIAAKAVALPANGDMVTNTWYYVDVLSNSGYDLTATTLGDVVYTTDGTILIENQASVTTNFSSTNPVDLNAGRYYIKSSSANNFAFEAHTKNYTVGDVTATSIADNTYQQSLTTVTFTLGNAITNDGTAALAIQGTPVAKLNDGTSDVADGALSISGNVVTATYTSVILDPAKTYTITLPADAVAWDKNTTNKNTGIVITFKTPAVFDGDYYLYDATNKVFLARGGASGTRAVVDKYGVPFTLTTSGANASLIEFKDWTGVNMFFDKNNHADCWIFTDGGSGQGDNRLFAFEKTTGGYYLRDAAKDVYIKHDNSVLTVPTTTEGEAAVWTVLTPAERNAILTAYTTDNYQNIINAATLSTTSANFVTYLSSNFAAKDKTSSVNNAKITDAAGSWTWTGVRDQDGQPAYNNAAEAWNATGVWTQTIDNLPQGIYRIKINAFERRTTNATSYALGEAGFGNVTSSYLKANDEQVRIKSWYEEVVKDGNNYDPNNMSQAVTAFNNDKFKSEVYTYVGNDGNLTLTIAKPNYIWDCWLLWNNITLTYFTDQVEAAEVTALLTTAEEYLNKPMLATLKQAISDAKTALEGNSTIANYNALQTAIDDSQTSVDSYAAMKTNYLDRMKALLDKTNVYQASLKTSLYDDYLTQYNNGTISNADANALNAYSGDKGARPVDNLLMPSWTIGGQATGDKFYQNTWSNEGASDGSNFLLPFYEYWVADADVLTATTLEATQAGLEANEIYEISAWVRVRQSNAGNKIANGVTLQAGAGTAIDVSAGTKIGESKLYIGEYKAYGQADANGNIAIKFVVAENSNISWLAFRDLKYAKVDAVDIAQASDYTDLNTAISDAEAKTLGFEDGEYAPYNNIAAFEALATAKAIDQTAINLKATISAAITTLNNAWTANATDVECVYNGNYADELTGWTCSSWGQKFTDVPNAVAEGNTTAYRYNPGSLQYGNTGVYTMPLKANTVYQLKYYYGALDQNVTPTVSVLNSTDGMAAMPFTATSTNYKTSMILVNMVFVTGAAGDYVLSINGDKNLVVTGVSIKKAANQVLEFADNAVMPTYAPGTYPTVKINRTLTAGNWATAVYPFAVPNTAVDNIAVLESYNASTGALGFTSATESEANKPFLMRSTAGTDEISLSYVDVKAAAATDATAGTYASLKGVYASTPITNAAKNYVLSNNKIWSVGAAGATIPAYRAYIQITEGAQPAPLFFTVDGETTGINMVQGEGFKVNGEVYDLQGRKVAKPAKGLYIQNGRKVMIK